MISSIFYFHPYLGKMINLTNKLLLHFPMKSRKSSETPKNRGVDHGMDFNCLGVFRYVLGRK